jgi:hypothetical protein
MHVSTAIQSDMVINIYYIVQQTQVNISGFTGTMILKDMPNALWASYDSNNDPASNSNPPDLKDPSTPSTRLCMGVQIQTPVNPINLLQSGIQDFDPTISFKENIGVYQLDPTEQTDTDFLAGPALFPGETPVQQWSDFAKDWTTASVAGQKYLGTVAADATQGDGMLKMAAHWLGWDNPPPSASKPVADTTPAGQKLPWVLDGKTPTSLIGSLGTEYAVLPRECGTTG